MPKKNKSVSDKILDLINPTPVHFDPEADIHTETAARVADNDFDDDDFSDDGALSDFRKRNVQLIEEVDKRYAGKKVTRKSIGSFVEKDEEPSSSGDGSDADNSEENLSDDDGGDNSDNNEKEIDGSNDESNEELSGEESENDSGSDDSENGEDLSGVEVEDSDAEDANDSSNFVHLATKDTGAEIDKGKAIHTQLNLWDGLLEARISLQKVLSAANKLPQPAEQPVFVSQGGEEFAAASSETRQAVSDLLDKLIELREQRLMSFSETKGIEKGETPRGPVKEDNDDEEITSSEDEDDGGKPKKKAVAAKNGKPAKQEAGREPQKPRQKRKLEEYEEALAKQHADFAAYRNETIQRWNDKTRVSTGKMSSRNFSGFEQPTLKQIEQILSNMPRLVARTRTKRTPFRCLGKPAPAAEPADADAAVPAAAAVEEVDSEIFDDADFYHGQLRELIERKTGTAPLGRQWLALQSARSKMKRKIDTKATKGRRLRFTPHAKLLSFMAPVPEDEFNEEARGELFSSLFGARQG